jgi:hypothetical protein
MTWTEGIDAAWSRPTPDQLIAAGKKFIIGYVSHDPSKNLTKAECQAYLDAGIGVGLVWETTTNRALSGAPGGHADGIDARQQARDLGFPDEKPIGFAVDFQASAQQLAGPIRAYGAAYRTAANSSGVYGGKATVRYFADNDLADVYWQTYAWSTTGTTVARMRANPYDIGWDPRAQVQQYHNGVSISGHDTDLDRAIDLSAFWMKENQDMTAPTSDDNARELMLSFQPGTTKGWTGKEGTTAGTDLGGGANAARDALAQSKANGASLTEIKAKLDSMTTGAVDIDALVAALRPVIAEEVAKVTNGTTSTFHLLYEPPTTS